MARQQRRDFTDNARAIIGDDFDSANVGIFFGAWGALFDYDFYPLS